MLCFYVTAQQKHVYKLPQAQKILHYRLCHQGFHVGSLADRYKHFRETYCPHLQDIPLVPIYQITQKTMISIPL